MTCETAGQLVVSNGWFHLTVSDPPGHSLQISVTRVTLVALGAGVERHTDLKLRFDNKGKGWIAGSCLNELDGFRFGFKLKFSPEVLRFVSHSYEVR